MSNYSKACPEASNLLYSSFLKSSQGSCRDSQSVLLLDRPYRLLAEDRRRWEPLPARLQGIDIRGSLGKRLDLDNARRTSRKPGIVTGIVVKGSERFNIQSRGFLTGRSRVFLRRHHPERPFPVQLIVGRQGSRVQVLPRPSCTPAAW